MSSERPRRLRLAVTLAGVLALVLVNGGRADAATTTGTTTDPVQAAAGWLATQFEDSTNVPSPTGDHFHYFTTFTNYGENADAIFGLAAAGAGKDKIAIALANLVTNADNYADFSGAQGGPNDGSIGKLALAAEVAGVSGTTATSFGGHNLIAALNADECTVATVPYDTFDDTVCAAPGAAKNIFSSVSESLVLLAEARNGVSGVSANALAYFDSLQCADGGFSTFINGNCTKYPSGIDQTSYAIMALSLLGPTQATHLANAVTYLRSQQDAAGSWGQGSVASTGLAMAALSAQGVNVASARSWVLSQQVPAGSAGAGAFEVDGAFTPTDVDNTSPSVLDTAQGITGLAAGGTLATLSAASATAGTSAFAPTETLPTSSAAIGSTVTVTGNGFAAGEQVQAVIHSTPVTVGNAVASAGGSVSIRFAVPASVAVGAHTLTLTGLTSGLSVSSALAIAAAPVVATTTPTTSTTTTTAAAAATDDVLANTGTPGRAVADLGALGVLSLLVGTGLLLASKRQA